MYTFSRNHRIFFSSWVESYSSCIPLLLLLLLLLIVSLFLMLPLFHRCWPFLPVLSLNPFVCLCLCECVCCSVLHYWLSMFFTLILRKIWKHLYVGMNFCLFMFPFEISMNRISISIFIYVHYKHYTQTHHVDIWIQHWNICILTQWKQIQSRTVK